MPAMRIALAVSLSLLVTAIVSPNLTVIASPIDILIQVGPFVDRVVYQVIEGGDPQVLALLNGEIDLIGDVVDPVALGMISTSAPIEIGNVPRNGYGYIVIKTDKYPLNVTDFRRAFAFALDKHLICDEVWDGLADPQDSCVPWINPWSIEGQLPYTYYEADIAMGEHLLDRAGFADVDSDGWREAPDGSDFDILIEGPVVTHFGPSVGDLAEDALVALHINASSEETDFYNYLNRLYFHGDFDMVFLGDSFTDFDVDWLAYEYWSEYADEPYWNFPCWQNATYDSWRDQLLHSTDYDEVYEAATEMQRIWVHSCPVVICYENLLLSAYRTDTFEGYVNDVSDGVPGWWTNYRTHLKNLKGVPLGGTLRISSPLDLDAFNFMAVSTYDNMRLRNNLYDSLIRQGPDGIDIPWLAEKYTIETHSDNPGISMNRTRLSFDIVRNATWTDGYLLTAQDVAFTLNYYLDAPGNPYGADLGGLIAAYAPSTYRVVLELSGESYWHLHTVGYKPIIPEHIFSSIGPEGWNTWNPQPGAEDFVTSGPFYISHYESDEFLELAYNPSYFHGIPRDSADTGPVVNHPSNITYFHGQTGNRITWLASDFNPAMFVVYLNDSVYLNDVWDGGDIEVNIDGLDLGVHAFSLWVIDKSFSQANDTVYVHVLVPPTTGEWPFGPLSPLSLAITLISLAVASVVFVLTAKTRRAG